MKQYTKAGLLILTLAIPALIFIFLKGFTTNHYVLPYFNPQLDKQGQVLRNGADTVFIERGSIVLKGADTTSTTIPLLGNFTVIGFLPEECDDRCRLYLEYLSRVAKIQQAVPNLKVITLTDGAGLESIGRTYGMGSEVWKSYTFPLTEENNALATELNIYKNSVGSKTNFSFSRLFLLDAKGYTRGYFDFSDPAELDRLMAEIRVLDYELQHSK